MDIDGLDVIKAFISCVKEYNKQRTEAVSQKIQRYLQILSTISDTSIFDPNSTEGAEFYVNLYELMSTLDSRNGLMWYAVSVLEEACKNGSAHHALIHTYKFTPILTQLLSGHLFLDKQIKVLRLLQEFTYGVKILWQNSHLPLLISILTKWIKEHDKSSELVSLSLGVLVNLCYKNLPAVYVLRRTVDIKVFIRSILGQAKDNLDVKVQGFKMLIILEEVSGEVTDGGILSCVTWTFKRLYEAFESQNVNAMRHIVDFFKDMADNNNFKEVYLKYPNYVADTEKLLKILENKDNETGESECVNLLLEFLQSVILLEIPGIENLYVLLTKVMLYLSCNPRISEMALQVICSVTAKSRGTEIHSSVSKELELVIPTLLPSLNGEYPLKSDIKNTMTALLGLLLELIQEPRICEKILSTLQPEVLKSYFSDIISSDMPENDRIFNESSFLFYLQGLSLVSALSSLRGDWNALFTELIQHKKIKLKLAAALYTGSPEVKCQVLELINHISKNKRLLKELSHCLNELQQLVGPVIGLNHLRSSNGFNLHHNGSLENSCQQSITPLLSLAQQNRLDECIATVQQAISSNQLGSIGTAAVLELYEYRVAAMSHTESVLQGNLHMIDDYCTQLRHRISIMTSEMNKLLSVLHNKEESLETSQAAVTSLQRDLSALELSLQNTQMECAQVTSELKEKIVAVEELSMNLSNAKNLLDEKEQEFKEVVSNLKKDVESKAETIEQKSKELKEMSLVIQNSEKKIKQQEGLIKSFEKSICEKDDEIAQYQAEIAELEAMRNVILKVTMEKESKRGKNN